MNESKIAKRYAEAVFTLGKEKGKLDILLSQFNVLKQVFAQQPELSAFLSNPGISMSQKKQFAKEAFKDFDKDVLHTIMLLMERHRTDELPLISNELSKRVQDEKGIAEMTISSVRHVDDARQHEIAESFKKRLGKKEITIKNEIDPSLIGGLKIRVGNTIYDGSVQNKLQRLERTIRAREITRG